MLIPRTNSPTSSQKVNFTRDEWNHLLRLFNIMKFSTFSCRHFPSIEKPNTMSKRAQERRTGEEPVVSKSKPVSLISRVGLGCVIQPGDSQRSVRDRVGQILKSGTEMTIPFLSTGKPMREISEIGARNSESTYKGEVGPPQSSSL